MPANGRVGRVVRHAQFHSREVSHAAHRFGPCHQATAAGVRPARETQAFALDLLGEGLADVTIQHLPRMVGTGQPVRHVQHPEIGDHCSQNCIADYSDIDVAGDRCLECRVLIAQNATREDTGLNGAAGEFAQPLREVSRPNTNWIVVRGRIIHPDRYRTLRQNRHGRSRGDRPGALKKPASRVSCHGASRCESD